MAQRNFPKAKRLISTKKMNHDEWLEARRSGIGGSEIASLLGINPYSSAIDVWLDKKGVSEPIKPNYQMRLGSLAEDSVAQIWSEDNPDYIVEKCNAILQNIEYDFAFANVDRLFIDNKSGEMGILEIKNISGRGAGAWYGDEPPYYYQAQVMWYLAVTGLKKGKLVANIANNEMLEFDIDYDPIVVKQMMDIANKFWTENVLKDVRPEPMHTDAGNITKFFNIASEEIKDLSHMKEAFEKRAELDEQIKALSNDKKTIENTIKIELAECKRGLVDGQKAVSVSRSERTSLDSKGIKADHPEIFEKYSKSTEVITYRF